MLADKNLQTTSIFKYFFLFRNFNDLITLFFVMTVCLYLLSE